MDDSPFPKSCLEFFRELERRQARYMIVGLSAAALQGAIIATDDVDLWFERLPHEGLEDAARAVGAVYISPWDLRPPSISGPGLNALDLVMTMHGLGSFDDEYQHVRWIELEDIVVPVLSLGRIIESKRSTNRPKDRAVLPLLEELARTLDQYEPRDEK